jgi:hypothetical protein
MRSIYLRRRFWAAASLGAALALWGCGVDTVDDPNGSARGKADTDQYGAKKMQNSEGRYVEAQWDAPYADNFRETSVWYTAEPAKGWPLDPGKRDKGADGFNFWIVDEEAVPYWPDNGDRLYVDIDAGGCSTSSYDVVLMHFAGRKGDDDYHQAEAQLELLMPDGMPIWRTPYGNAIAMEHTKGPSKTFPWGDARGPWKLFFNRKDDRETNCTLDSVTIGIIFSDETLRDSCETGGYWEPIDLQDADSGYFCRCPGESVPNHLGNCAMPEGMDEEIQSGERLPEDAP